MPSIHVRRLARLRFLGASVSSTALSTLSGSLKDAPQRLHSSTLAKLTSPHSLHLILLIGHFYIVTHVPRFKKRPSPGLPLYSPFSTTTRPRESTVSTTPRIVLPS